jgi:uncharacterized OB-fold protein
LKIKPIKKSKTKKGVDEKMQNKCKGCGEYTGGFRDYCAHCIDEMSWDEDINK